MLYNVALVSIVQQSESAICCFLCPLGWEDPLENEMAPHSSTLAWKIPWTEESGGLHTVPRVTESDMTDGLSTHTYIEPRRTVKTQLLINFFFLI